jgi:hypothetical protein
VLPLQGRINKEMSMARPIKETPVLTGKDATRFAKEMDKPKSYSIEEKAQMKKARKIFRQNGLFI